MINAFTVDLEPWMCYYRDLPLSKSLDDGNLMMTTNYLLDILEENDVTATFFTIGIVFEWFPQLLEEIQSRGHEIAFHSYSHGKSDGDMLDSEITRSRDFIQRFRVVGFRAPRMEISMENIRSLASANFLYDSSTYGSCVTPKKRICGLLEVPVSTYPIHDYLTFPKTLVESIRQFELPIGSGLFMGIFSSNLINSFINKLNTKGVPFVPFIHPWQLTHLPEAKLLKGISNLNLLYNINLSEKKLSAVLRSHTFVSIREALSEWNDV